MTAVGSADITRLANALRESGQQSDATTQRVAIESANFLLTQMEVRVPVATGELRRSLTVKIEAHRIKIGPTAEYAPFVEFDTRPHKITAKNGKALSFTVNGAKIVVRSVNHPGTKAQPFVRPAFDDWIKAVGPAIAEANVQTIQDKAR